MDIPSRIGRAVWLAIAGVGLALAWAVVVTVVGGGPAAHAAGAEDDTPGTGVSTLIGAVDDAAPVITGSAGTVGTAVGAVADVVTSVTPTTATVAPTVSTSRAAATHARTDIHRAVDAVVSPTSTTAILDTAARIAEPATQTPLVGTVVAPLHLMAVLTSATSAADGVLSIAAGAVDDAMAPITTAARGAPPRPLGPPPPGADTASSAASAGPSWATLQAWWSAAASAGAQIATTSAIATVTAAPATLSTLFSPPGASAAAGSSSSGPAGAGSGAAALLAAGLLFAHRAWVRTGRPGDDPSPAAPVYATDVSPD